MSDSHVVASQIINPSVPLEVTVQLENGAGELVPFVVKLGYHRARISKRFMRDLEAIQAMDDDDEAGIKEAFDAQFLKVVSRWNVLQEEGGAAIPLTPEAIAPLDSYFIGELLFAIVKHALKYTPGEAASEKPNVTPLNGSLPRMARKTGSRRA